MSKELISVAECPVCKSSERKIDRRRNEFFLYRCLKCGLVYISPRPESIDSIYTDDTSSSTSTYYINSEHGDRKTFASRLELIEKQVERGRLLDIGCSVGTMLQIAAANGWEITGVEPNPVSAEICRKKGINVYNTFFDKSFAESHTGEFEAVYLGDVIEHTAEPAELLCNVRTILKKNGVLMIVTPDFGSAVARALQIKPLEHIIYFERKSLLYLLTQSGLSLVKINTTTRDRNLNALPMSTTFAEKPAVLSVIKLMAKLGLSRSISFFLRTFVRDELLLLARKL